jgi:hypothetical protein
MDWVVSRAVKLVWSSGALWEENRWKSEACLLAEIERMSDREQFELFQKAIADLRLDIENTKDTDSKMSAAIGREISEIEKACKFLSVS